MKLSSLRLCRSGLFLASSQTGNSKLTVSKSFECELVHLYAATLMSHRQLGNTSSRMPYNVIGTSKGLTAFRTLQALSSALSASLSSFPFILIFPLSVRLPLSLFQQTQLQRSIGNTCTGHGIQGSRHVACENKGSCLFVSLANVLSYKVVVSLRPLKKLVSLCKILCPLFAKPCVPGKTLCSLQNLVSLCKTLCSLQNLVSLCKTLCSLQNLVPLQNFVSLANIRFLHLLFLFDILLSLSLLYFLFFSSSLCFLRPFFLSLPPSFYWVSRGKRTSSKSPALEPTSTCTYTSNRQSDPGTLFINRDHTCLQIGTEGMAVSSLIKISSLTYLIKITISDLLNQFLTQPSPEQFIIINVDLTSILY